MSIRCAPDHPIARTARRAAREGRDGDEDDDPLTSPDWDAATYDRIADPMTRWGSAVLDRLPLRGDERVLDVGCGSGRVTEQLLARLPRGRVVALDGSPAMIDEARRRLRGEGDRVTFVVADLLAPLPVEPPVDAILSTATFHWITDHDLLFRNLAGVVGPGGMLVAQCGGAGNIATVLAATEAVAPTFGLDPGWRGPWLFATPEATAERLRAAGFVEIDTWLNPEPTPLEPGEQLETFLATVILREHLARLAEAGRASFVAAVAGRLPRPEIDYIRLNIVARRAG
jgi:trans-aconitate 2-methyltransferase